MPEFGKLMGALTQRGLQGQLPPQAMTILAFLAGAGLDTFSKAMERIRGPQAKGGAVAKDARSAGQQGMSPQMAQIAQAMMRRGQQPGMNTPMGAPPAPVLG